MPLINCPECKKEISSLTRKCPNCGAPVKQLAVPLEQQQKTNHQITVGWVLGAVGLFFAVNGMDEEKVFLVPIGAVFIITAVILLIRNYKKKWDNR